jgi:transposase
MRERKKFTSEFKREAVRLMESSQKPSSEVARELGVRRNQLYKWKEQLSRDPKGVGSLFTFACF